MINEEDFDPQILLGLYKGSPAARSSSLTKSFKVSSAIAAAYMVAVFESMERYVPDSKQIEFEKDVLKYFKKLLKERHERTVHHRTGPQELE